MSKLTGGCGLEITVGQGLKRFTKHATCELDMDGATAIGGRRQFLFVAFILAGTFCIPANQ